LFHIYWTEQGCIFNSDSIDYGDGVCVLTYTPQESLRPDTVVAQNFTVKTQNKQIDVLETVYYPYENTLKLVLDEEVGEKVDFSSNGVLDVNENSFDLSATLYPYVELEAQQDSLNLTGISIFRDGILVNNIINSINADIRLMITNSSADSYEGVCVNITDANDSLVAKQNFDINAYSNKEIWVNVRGYLFTNNDFNYSFE